MSEGYEDLFPFDISSQNLLLRRVFRGAIPDTLFSAIWRHFLIIGPRSGKLIRTPHECGAILTASRAAFTKLQTDSRDRQLAFPRRPDYTKILAELGKVFISIQSRMDMNQWNALFAVIPYLVEPNCREEQLNAILNITARMYHQFHIEAKPNTDNSHQAVLMDAAFVLHDLYACMTTVLNTIKKFCDISKSPTRAQEIFQHLTIVTHTVSPTTDCSELSDRIPVILPLYQSLFARYLPNWSNLLHIWTVIFSSIGDPVILHMVYACIYSSTGLVAPAVPELPMLVYRLQISRWMLGVDTIAHAQVLLDASKAVGELIDMIKKKDSPARRGVIKYQITQLVKVSRGLIHPDELIPFDLVLKRVHKLRAY
jgi:hypothetical protein